MRYLITLKYDFQPSINHYRINQFLILLCHRNSTLVKNVINFYYIIVHYLTCFYKITSRHLKFKRLHKRKLFFIRAFLELKLVDTYCTKTKKRLWLFRDEWDNDTEHLSIVVTLFGWRWVVQNFWKQCIIARLKNNSEKILRYKYTF